MITPDELLITAIVKQATDDIILYIKHDEYRRDLLKNNPPSCYKDIYPDFLSAVKFLKSDYFEYLTNGNVEGIYILRKLFEEYNYIE